jgi:gamma-glutamyltranspeptidase
MNAVKTFTEPLQHTDLRYASRRMPVLANQGVVATSEPLAAQAGLRMLQSGGNAVDAAIATAITLTVVEPTSNGIGSDAFALVWDGTQMYGLNGSGRAPMGQSVRGSRPLARAGSRLAARHRAGRARRLA